MNFFEGRLIEEGGRLWFDEGTGKLPVPDWAAAGLRDRVGTDIVLGVRPEALSDDRSARFELSDNALAMKILLIQPLGDTMHVYLATGRHPQIVADLRAFYGLSVGQSLSIYFDPNRLHFFERGELGKTLVYNEAFARGML